MTTQTWKIDAVHSTIGFSVRHMVIAKVGGHFSKFEGSLAVQGEDLTTGSVEVKIDAASIHTNVEARDNHLRSPDFFDVATYPHLLFRSRKVERTGGDHYRVTGDLTIRGVTREVVLDTEFLGQLKESTTGAARLAFSARTSVDRRDFGLTWNKAIETGGVMVGERVDISLDVALVKEAAQAKVA
jgi:polyisoprenoid-binding protein YceI